jgi:hypothetical protein
MSHQVVAQEHNRVGFTVEVVQSPCDIHTLSRWIEAFRPHCLILVAHGQVFGDQRPLKQRTRGNSDKPCLAHNPFLHTLRLTNQFEPALPWAIYLRLQIIDLVSVLISGYCLL